MLRIARSLARGLPLLVGLAALAGAFANPAGATEVVAEAGVGPALLTQSRSKAIGHLVKPAARVGVRWLLSPRVELGGVLTGVLDGSEHYRVLGALAQARCALWQRQAFSLGGSAALGVGYDADILHADLRASGTVLPYGFLSFDAHWWLSPRWSVGADLGWENLSIIRLGLTVARRLGGKTEVSR